MWKGKEEGVVEEEEWFGLPVGYHGSKLREKIAFLRPNTAVYAEACARETAGMAFSSQAGVAKEGVQSFLEKRQPHFPVPARVDPIEPIVTRFKAKL